MMRRERRKREEAGGVRVDDRRGRRGYEVDARGGGR